MELSQILKFNRSKLMGISIHPSYLYSPYLKKESGKNVCTIEHSLITKIEK